MKINTTTARRQLVEGILAPQLHTLHHKRTGKLLRLVAIPGSARGDYLRQCYAEAMLDLLDQNNMLVVRKPDPAEVYTDGQAVNVDLEPGDLAETPAPPPVEQKQRTYKRMMPGDHLADFMPADGTDPDLDEAAPALVAKTADDDAPNSHIARTAGDLTPSDSAREAFERLGARMKAREFISRMMAPLLQRMGCTVTVMDNADARTDGKPTKVTVFVDLPTHDTGETTQ